jgi:Septum formation initiator
MKVITKKKNRKNIVLKVAVLTFVVYIVFTLVNQQVEINSKQKQVDSVKQQIALQEMKNQEMKQVLDSGEQGNNDYIERVARQDLDYANPDERVFINIAGN